MEDKAYVLQQNESCMGFLQRALGGQVSADTIKMIDILLEIVIPELSASDYSLSLCHHAREIELIISHNGKAIKEEMMDIIEDLVDGLHYRHQSRNHHTLKIIKRE